MATEILVKQGTQIRFCVSGDFSPADPGTDFTVGSPTNVTLTLSAVASAAGRQSNKVDLGATRAAQFSVYIAVDYTGETPSATGYTDLYWAPSASTTQGTGNVAGNSGADGACPDGALGSITLLEFLKQCQYIGTLFTHDGAVVQVGYAGTFSPKERYGQMIVVNNGGDAYEADNVEMAVWMNPIIDEAQTA
jgi:hypothetical protein